MRFIDFFAGIGGFRLGMEMAGHECVGHCEIDNFADKSYRAMHMPKESEWFAKDIRTVEYGDLPKAECYCFGFPCQSFSIAGSRGGFADTRGTLFFEVMRIAKERKPEYLFAENVAGLLSHDGGRTFGTILATLGELGYWWEYQVLNSKNFGVPQNRERVFIIGHLGGRGGRKVFPITSECQSVDGLQGQHVGTITTRTGVSKAVGTYIVEGEQFSQDRHGVMVKEATKQGYAITEPGGSINLEQPVIIGGMQKNQSVKTDGICTTLTSSMGTGGGYVPMVVASRGRNLEQPNSKTRRGRVGKGVANTITTSCNQAVIELKIIDDQGRIKDSYKQHGIVPTLRAQTHGNPPKVIEGDPMKQPGFRIRKLTPKECWRLQGFPDEYFERAARVSSDSQLYKQAGNSVTVNVICEIAKRLKESDG